MEYKYMQLLAENKIILPYSNKGMTHEEIALLEEKYNRRNSFPIAFLEYLLIAGKSDISSTKSHDLDLLQDYASESLIETNHTIERPFFVISGSDGCSQFHFFYLDEQEEYSQLHIAYPYYTE